MYARTTSTIADLRRLDEGIAYIRDQVMPAVQAMDGCVGLSMLCDRETGRCIVTTSWESEEARASSRERVREMRDQATGLLGGTPEVREWDVAVMHRVRPAGDGACTRVTWTRGDPAQWDRTIDALRMGLIPRLDELEGFCSISLMADRETGHGAFAATYADRQTLAATRRQVTTLREDFARNMDLEITEVAEFDLVLAHLHVPELV